MTPTLTRPRPAQRNVGGQLLVGTGVVAIALVGMLLMPGLRVPNFVGRITITNPTVYAVQVDVAGRERDGWLSLGGVTREHSRDSREVIDQGSTWVFRFTYGGHEAGDIVVSRSELKQSGWRLSIPTSVGDKLAASGLPPSAF